MKSECWCGFYALVPLGLEEPVQHCANNSATQKLNKTS